MLLFSVIGCNDRGDNNINDTERNPSSVMPLQVSYNNTIYNATGGEGACGKLLGKAYSIVDDGVVYNNIYWYAYQYEDRPPEMNIVIKTRQACLIFEKE